MLHLILVIVPIQKPFPHRAHPPIYLRRLLLLLPMFICPSSRCNAASTSPSSSSLSESTSAFICHWWMAPRNRLGIRCRAHCRGCLPHALQSH
ncbi:hypothetical protein B0H13DRAFT_2107539 [Mycena leptocephala]|nr:hypothetical protein B0H13DRAFT_2107539 [Mycena leptocephala]